MQKIIIVVIMLSLVLISCNTAEPEEIIEFDNSLVGEWYYRLVDSSNNGPKEFISGIQIKDDGTVNRLAIETSSGRLELLEYLGKISTTKDSQIEFFAYAYQPSFGGTYTLYSFNYELKENKLYFTSEQDNDYGIFNNYYTSTNIGVTLTEPVLSYFKWAVNTSENKKYFLTNSSISPSPLAYSYNENGNLIIKSAFEFYNPTREFLIKVNDFTGMGKYESSVVELQYYELNDDLAFEFNSQKDSLEINLFIGSITDERITGTFNMKLFPSDEYYKEPRIFSEGEFIIPLY